MVRRAVWLESVFKPRGIRVERWEIQEAWDVAHVQERVFALLERERPIVESGQIALNATGGTKPMSIGAYEVFRAGDLPIFYVHPEQDRLIWMHPAGRPVVDLANRIKLDAFLLAHGSRVGSALASGIPADRRALTDWLVTHTARLSRALRTLNWLAMQATGSLRAPVLDDVQGRDPMLRDLLDRLAAIGLITLSAGRVQFADESARFYANGGWLEEHVYAVFRELRREDRRIQDIARSVEIVREDASGGQVPNEIDVACLAENRFYLVECKTKAWKGSEGPGAEALYRLDALADLLGGLQGRAMLVSYLDLPRHVRLRAQNLRIRVCDGVRLQQLRGEIARWLA
jgi:hypothetical protein